MIYEAEEANAKAELDKAIELVRTKRSRFGRRSLTTTRF